MAHAQDAPEVARFYTRSRRFPKVLGRLHDGTRIPGGPYTLTQAFAGIAVGAFALTTRGQWGTGAILVDLPLTLAITWGAAWGVGRIPATRRNPIYIMAGAVAAVMRPVEGRYRDQTLRLGRPRFVSGAAAIQAGLTEQAATLSARDLEAVAPAATPVAAPAPQAGRAVTAVERLLQQSQPK